jgi:anti-sigma28 factor (negative regulator of flagellin synthesis)
MRLQLDSALTGAGIARSGETGQTAPTGGGAADSRRIGDSTGVDSIQISGPSSALSNLSAERTARVQQLTALVQGGSYQVPSSRVGRAIVDNALSQS